MGILNPTHVELSEIQSLSPDDPTPRGHAFGLELPGGERVEFTNDLYSDRVRCDHPTTEDGLNLGEGLWAEATRLGRGRIIVFADRVVATGLVQQGRYSVEAILPGHYEGRKDAFVVGAWPEASRRAHLDARRLIEVDKILERKAGQLAGPIVDDPTRPARVEDAEGIATLIAETFERYPTPSGCPKYIAKDIREGTPYRVVESDGEIVSCASADLDREARTAELTDCATRPSQRGKGHMRALLNGLMDDLRQMRYPTAFTLARAAEPGINIAFSKLGFAYRGRMTRSCRIGEGIEDMNVWSRDLN